MQCFEFSLLFYAMLYIYKQKYDFSMFLKVVIDANFVFFKRKKKLKECWGLFEFEMQSRLLENQKSVGIVRYRGWDGNEIVKRENNGKKI